MWHNSLAVKANLVRRVIGQDLNALCVLLLKKTYIIASARAQAHGYLTRGTTSGLWYTRRNPPTMVASLDPKIHKGGWGIGVTPPNLHCHAMVHLVCSEQHHIQS